MLFRYDGRLFVGLYGACRYTRLFLNNPMAVAYGALMVDAASEKGGAKMLMCPMCGRELEDSEKKEGGWDCRCGEFIPEGLAKDTEKLDCGGGGFMKRPLS